MGDKKHGIDKQLIRDLAALLTETDLSEIEVEQDDFRIRVTRAAPTMIAAAQPAAPAPVQAAPAAETATPSVDADPASHPGAVNSPMVGTTYLSPEPGAKPFVDIGDTVTVGQTLMIVEAMKHMNEVPSPVAGTVSAIMVTDGQPVEYGEVLMVIV